MATFSGGDVNSILALVRQLVPATGASAGDVQLSLLAHALCIAARSCGVSDRDHFLTVVGATFDEVRNVDLVPLGSGQQ